MATVPKKSDLPTLREQRSLLRGINLRMNANAISPSSFSARKDYLVQSYEEGKFLKDPERKGQAAPNPMTDPAAMEGMMGMMKGNMAMIVPQTLIMGWINAFFSGFVISMLFPLFPSPLYSFLFRLHVSYGEVLIYFLLIVRLPFPLTIKFKSMLQAGVLTRDMDPQWMSSISWYVLCIFGLQSVFVYILGSDNGTSPFFSRPLQELVIDEQTTAASQMAQQMGQMAPGAGAQMFGPGVDPDKQFQGEAENLAVLAHQYTLEGVEQRVLSSVRV